nr:unnamed protein product [Digitaria exilis]
MPGLDLNEPINWDEIEEFEGGTLDLSYDFVWDSANEEVVMTQRMVAAMTQRKMTSTQLM